MSSPAPLYLGFDLSTQQLKGVAVTPDLKVQHLAKFDFDADQVGFPIHKGVITNEAEHEVYPPIALWLQALDALLTRLQATGLDFSRVRGISGAGQQHGSVYWSAEGERDLARLDPTKTLAANLVHAFSHPYSPNWQDASSQSECDAFDGLLGSEEELANRTGSKAHHRFTGPQILRFQNKHHTAYERTSRISLVSSFLASIFLGKVAPIDISDVCGMNLWDIKAGAWDEQLLALAAGGDEPAKQVLKAKLGAVPEDGGKCLGPISPYFVTRYGFSKNCAILPFTGDNPATILALPLRSMDAMVSLGTSTTFLMSTPKYAPDPAVHFFNHPTTAGLYMFMLCYKNGGLAREQVRDRISGTPGSTWGKFDKTATETPILGQKDSKDVMRLGLYFPRPEIVPNVKAGEWRFFYDPVSKELMQPKRDQWKSPRHDARAIVESQLLSLRLRSRKLMLAPSESGVRHLPPQPRRVYLVGGASRNAAIAKIAGQVLGGVDGVYRLDVGENACALGAAYKAVWATEKNDELGKGDYDGATRRANLNAGETFEDLIAKRWDEAGFIEKIDNGYREGVWERYGEAVEGLDMVEKRVLAVEQDERLSSQSDPGEAERVGRTRSGKLFHRPTRQAAE